MSVDQVEYETEDNDDAHEEIAYVHTNANVSVFLSNSIADASAVESATGKHVREPLKKRKDNIKMMI